MITETRVGGYQCLRVVLKNCVFARLLTNCLTFEWLGWHLGGLDPKNLFFDFGLKGVTNSQEGCQNIPPLQNPVHATVENSNSIFLGIFFLCMKHPPRGNEWIECIIHINGPRINLFNPIYLYKEKYKQS